MLNISKKVTNCRDPKNKNALPRSKKLFPKTELEI